MEGGGACVKWSSSAVCRSKWRRRENEFKCCKLQCVRGEASEEKQSCPQVSTLRQAVMPLQTPIAAQQFSTAAAAKHKRSKDTQL